MSTAFEAITTRQAWYAGEPIAKYDAAMYNSAGKLVKADGTGQFAGIVQYGAETDADMTTVVKGTFPAVCSVDIAEGSKVTVDSVNPGKFKVAVAGNVVYGIALTSAIKDNLFTLSMADVPAPQII